VVPLKSDDIEDSKGPFVIIPRVFGPSNSVLPDGLDPSLVNRVSQTLPDTVAATYIFIRGRIVCGVPINNAISSTLLAGFEHSLLNLASIAGKFRTDLPQNSLLEQFAGS
jgi:hypothetical protein